MHIYFSGLGGVAIGPLALVALDAGYEVSGSDLAPSIMTDTLTKRGINVQIGQDGSQIKYVHQTHPIDWVVYTSALPLNHPELQFAKDSSIKVSKRDELLNIVLYQKQLKLVAISGTHGKTTTTAMLVWLFKQFDIPISYSVGTTINFGLSGQFEPGSQYFIYECDEYDRNFLKFRPSYSLITNIDYDHPDTYPTTNIYRQAFSQFINQSDVSFMWDSDMTGLMLNIKDEKVNIIDKTADEVKLKISQLPLPGEHNRQNAYLALVFMETAIGVKRAEVLQALAAFPGSDRRFEKLADNLYTDYGHHPQEIAATLQLAREVNDRVMLIYEPHQNLRQHQIANDYKYSMNQAEIIYWLPTYLSREDPNLPVLTPDELISNLINKTSAHPAQLNSNLWDKIQAARKDGVLVLAMGAGSIDGWIRRQLA